MDNVNFYGTGSFIRAAAFKGALPYVDDEQTSQTGAVLRNIIGGV
jgi:hypothetical protein